MERSHGPDRRSVGWLHFESVVVFAFVFALFLLDAAQLLAEAAWGRRVVAVAVPWLVSAHCLAYLLYRAAWLAVGFDVFLTRAFVPGLPAERLAELACEPAWLPVGFGVVSADARFLGVGPARALGEPVDRVGVEALVAEVVAAGV